MMKPTASDRATAQLRMKGEPKSCRAAGAGACQVLALNINTECWRQPQQVFAVNSGTAAGMQVPQAAGAKAQAAAHLKHDHAAEDGEAQAQVYRVAIRQLDIAGVRAQDLRCRLEAGA